MNLKHNRTDSREYISYTQMKQRCYNSNHKSYNSYGGRGIKVCERWLTFANFFEDMGERPKGMTLDRIDNDGDYTPGNCRWANRIQQQSNTTRSRIIKIGNSSHTLAHWCRKRNIKYTTAHQRIFAYGWSVERALNI